MKLMKRLDTDPKLVALRREIYEVKKQHRAKVSQALYYTTRSLMGIPWWTWAWLIGCRGRGKSYSVIDTFLSYRKRYGAENVKCYYFRISDTSVQAMLANKGRKCIDAMLVRKYDLDLTTHAQTLYDHGKPMIDFYPLVSAAKKGKGVAEYDPEWLTENDHRYIFIILDEFMMAEGIEKKSIGSPVEQFKIYIENILRDQAQLPRRAVMIFGCANAVSECSDFLAQLAGFIPEKPGRYKLKRKHMIIDNIPNSDAYIQKRSESIGADIMNYQDDANYTNVVKRDLETLKPKSLQLNRVTAIIKFSKDPSHWFTLWNGNIIKQYTGQTSNNIICMKRYLDGLYTPELAASVIERFDARAFMFNDLISQATFAAELKIIKAK